MPDYIGLEISQTEMEDFIESRIWQALKFEIEERDKILVNALRNSRDTEFGGDDIVRGRLSELDYIKSIPESILADIKLSKSAQDQKDNKGE